MTALPRYEGVVRRGRIELSSQDKLPEGSHVVVILTGAQPPVEENAAQYAANRWLVENVGNMLAAGEGRLAEVEGRPVWRFEAFITGRGRPPIGPVGYVDIDAHQGKPLADEDQAKRLMSNAQALVSSILPPE
jgi:hypothetical protein